MKREEGVYIFFSSSPHHHALPSRNEREFIPFHAFISFESIPLGFMMPPFTASFSSQKELSRFKMCVFLYYFTFALLPFLCHIFLRRRGKGDAEMKIFA